ncbi:MAG: M28 family peptidase [Phycisphaerales bacterium]|nr:M28 family peptidase [Phycisphaerales bacterium]
MLTLLSAAALSIALLNQTESRTTTQQAAADLAVYRQHVLTLANPFMEGRGLGTHGNRMAAEYFEWHFRQLGLRPAFGGDAPTYLQEFAAGRQAKSDGSEVAIIGADGRREPLVAGSDFNVLGNSGATSAEAEIVFVGYSIPKLEGDRPGDGVKAEYATYSDFDDLKGKLALMFRYEPMNDAGRSRLTENGAWSSAAAIAPKIRAALDCGAAGVLVVPPPGAADPAASRLESTAASENWSRPLDGPAIMLSTASAERLLALAEMPGQTDKSLLALRKIADAPRTADDKASRLIPLGKVRLAVNTRIERAPRTTWNVGGVLPGRGPLAEQFIIIGGHLDHVGYGNTGGSRSGEYGIIHPGADDNASGASGVLLAARILTREYASDDRPRRSIMFLGFSAEEMGLLGSAHFVKDSPISAAALYAMLNMDMIGRARDRHLEVLGVGTAAEFSDLLKPLFDSSGLNIKTSATGRGPSDHATFYGKGVPVLHFFTGLHDEYHTPRDTADLINCEDAVDIVRLVCDTARSLASRPLDQPLTFTSTDKGRQPSRPEPDPAADAPPKPPVRVRFGVRPGYGDEGEGVVVEDVTEGTAAAEAGIQPGDLLTRWNGKEMPGPAAMMDFLREHKPGDVIDITLKRKNEETTVRVTLKSRDQAVK